MTKIKAILIDAKNREVRPVEFERGNLDEMYKLIGCDCFTIAPLNREDNESLFVDDEGLINGTEDFFFFSEAFQPLAGNGLIVGCDEEGESCDTSIKFEDIVNNIRFASRYELAIMKMQRRSLEDFRNWPHSNFCLGIN